MDSFESGDRASLEIVLVGVDSFIYKLRRTTLVKGQTNRVSFIVPILCKLDRISCRLDKSTTRDFVARWDLSLRERSSRFRLRRNLFFPSKRKSSRLVASLHRHGCKFKPVINIPIMRFGLTL